MAFGNKVASDVRDSGGEWIRRFGDGETQIRICPMENVNSKGNKVYGTAAWPQEREHYDEGARIAYPCLDTDDCIGCNDSDKKVRDRSAKIYFHALDEEGNAHIYKIGRKLYKRFVAKEQRLLARDPKNKQPLSDLDYIVIRSGKGFETDYDAEAGDKYEIDFPDESELPDIGEALSDAYNDAAEIYGDGPDDDEDEDDEPEPEPVRAPKRAPRKKAAPKPEPEDDEDEEEEKPKPRKRAAKKAAPKPKPEPEPEEDEDEDEGGLPKEPSEDQIKSASSEDLRDWLDDRGVEYPVRAPRRRLVEIALNEPPY